MDYTKRTVRCSSVGITREEARNSLEQSTTYTPGSEILSLTKRGNKWVAVLLEPKTAEFPPAAKDESNSAPPQFEDDDDGPPGDDAPEADSGDSEGPEGDAKPSGEDKGDKPKSEKAELGELVALVHQIIDHLGIGADPAAMGAEDGSMPGPDGLPLPPPPGAPDGPPPHGGPPGGGGQPQVVMHKTKLKPGDVPPGQLPIGAPAFSSTAPLHRMASFDAFDDDAKQKTIKQAKAELEELYGPHGFKVRQIKRVEGGTRIAAKLSRR